MKDKLHDVPYCGVSEEKIASLTVESLNVDSLNVFLHMISERYKIHLRKDVKQIDPPYTKNRILKNFRFTNVRREHDRETKWVIKHITSNPDLSYDDKLLNCILFRLFNKHQTAELIDMPIHFSSGYAPEEYRPVFEAAFKADPKRVMFTGAFITGGLKRALKWYLPEDDPSNSMEMRMMHFMQYLISDGIVHKLNLAKSPEDICNLLKSYMGIGEFLAYQMFVDFTYIHDFPFSENHFTIAGPGAKLGLKYLFDDQKNLTSEELIFWLRDNWTSLNDYNIERGGKYTVEPKILMRDLPEHDRCMNVMSIENCLCEFSKYYRAKNNLGRPRQKYRAQERSI